MVANVQSEPGRPRLTRLWIFVVGLVWLGTAAEAIRFELDARECWVHEVPSDGDLMHVSFVVIKLHNPWGLHHRRAANVGVDVTVSTLIAQPFHRLSSSIVTVAFYKYITFVAVASIAVGQLLLWFKFCFPTIFIQSLKIPQSFDFCNRKLYTLR